MKLPLINAQDEAHAAKRLAPFYEAELIPAEKKAYLTELEKSEGPYMAIEGSDGQTHYMMDAASQIATLGLGFNPSVFMGVAHFLESWTNNPNTKTFKQVHRALVKFLKRKTKWENLFLTYVNSGAEANETALGYAYKERGNKWANKVLAFEGSFHGRMMVTLSSTWNKSKREPFEWPEFLTEYCPFPELPGDEIHQPIPEGWRKFWDNASKKNFTVPAKWLKDPVLKSEVEALKEVRTKLCTGNIFAVITETMQCEGGDRYSSDRFHTALILMCRSFNVKVVHDEVQTGFHLGREFFWHHALKMKDLDGSQLNPDYVTCAKKAQVGMVLSHKKMDKVPDQFQVASVIRGYLHGMALDQMQDRILSIEEDTRKRLNALIEKYPNHLTRPRVMGLAFAVETPSAELCTKFIAERFKHGLLYYPAGDRTLRFRLNTAFSSDDMDFLFNEMDVLCDKIFNGKEAPCPNSVDTKERGTSNLYDWHRLLLDLKLDNYNGISADSNAAWEKTCKLFKEATTHDLVSVDESNFSHYRARIEKLQQDTYEPARQTDIEKFEKVANDPFGLALAVESDGELIAIVFASPLKRHPLDRGLRIDPFFEDEKSIYVIDTTVANDYQGGGLGRFLKYALTAWASAKDFNRIQGRNRDRMAASMLSINLSLGGYELNYLKEDYPDFERYRDVVYYTCPLKWTKPPLSLHSAIDSHIGHSTLDKEWMRKSLITVNNKICLSNFVSHDFLTNVEKISNQMPKELRHGYSCSGQSEAVDKVAKSLWYVSDKYTNRMLTFKLHSFGKGSFLSRSLSDHNDPYFKVDHLDTPVAANHEQILEQIEELTNKNKYLAIWIEPLPQKTMEPVPYKFLIELRRLTKEKGINLVFNETGAQAFRFNSKNYFASNDAAITPDASMVFLGGQAGMAFVRREKFVDKPLMMISTWDGDEFSFASYVRGMERMITQHDDYIKLARDFESKLKKMLDNHIGLQFGLSGPRGWITGTLPYSLRRLFKEEGDRHILCASFDAMAEFVKEWAWEENA
tara:strand:+ start:9067 stop:12141 length:3075 start_codon:yes stop_codon:yes gene_type:complete